MKTDRPRLHLVAPPPSGQMPFEADLFAFAKIGEGIFICFKGEWLAAEDALPAILAIHTWTHRAADEINHKTESLGRQGALHPVCAETDGDQA